MEIAILIPIVVSLCTTSTAIYLWVRNKELLDIIKADKQERELLARTVKNYSIGRQSKLINKPAPPNVSKR